MKQPFRRMQSTSEGPNFNKWVLLFSISLLASFSIIAWFLQRQFPTIEAEQSLASNLGFFLLINVNIIVVLVLAFLVVKNVIKLSLDRRRKILGAKLRTRLVVAFVGLSLIPTVLLFTVAKGIVERVLQGWFSPQVEASVDGSVKVASLYYDNAERELRHFATQLSRKLEQASPYLLSTELDTDGREALAEYLEEKREEYGIFEFALYRISGEQVLRTQNPTHAVAPPAINLALLRRAQRSVQVHAEQSLTSEFLRAYLPVRIKTIQGPATYAIGADAPEFILIATEWIAPQISSSLASVISAHDDYRELRTYRRPLANSYFLTLVIVTLLIVFAAVWVGFYLARGISIPIGLLAEGTQQVAHGNLDYQIPEVGDDELSVLVRSFNTMTEDLKGTTTELVERRRYMETLLAQVNVGVISLDLEGLILTCNESARSILETKFEGTSLVGSLFETVAPPAIALAVDSLRTQLPNKGSQTASSDIAVESPHGATHLHVSLTTLLNEDAQPLGHVVLLDNISELISAQRMAAWREVARRIAHEIKNPLTPIQLSAQRIQRRLASATTVDPQESQVILDATTTIVGQVEILRTLVNEFSRFARMPKTSLVTNDLGGVVREVVRFFSEAHPHIHFEERVDPNLATFAFDADQINRVLTNLLDNSIAAVESLAKSGDNTPPRIEVTVEQKAEMSMVVVSVSDNGIGVPAADKSRLFEPYFSTKHSGTGLGLAIVSTIIADHHGYIRVTDVNPHGTKVTFELPTRLEEVQELRRKHL